MKVTVKSPNEIAVVKKVRKGDTIEVHVRIPLVIEID